MKNDAQFFFCFAGFIGFSKKALLFNCLSFAQKLLHLLLSMVQLGACVLLFTEGLFWVFYLTVVLFWHLPHLNKNSTISKPNSQKSKEKFNHGKYLQTKILVQMTLVNQW